MTTFLVSIPCVDADSADRFRAWLDEQEVDVAQVAGRHVLVPTDRPPFAFDLAEAAVREGFAHDSEAARAATTFAERTAR